MHTRLQFTLLFLFLILNTSCSLKEMIFEDIVDSIEMGAVEFESESSWELMKNALPANAKMLEVLLRNAPENTNLLTLLSKIYGSYSFGILETEYLKSEEDSPEQLYYKQELNQTYLKAAQYGKRAILIKHPKCLEVIDNTDNINVCLKLMTAKDIDTLYWYGFSRAGYINNNLDLVDALASLGATRKIMEKVAELQGDFYYGGSHLFHLIYYAARPAMMGGDLKKALNFYYKAKKSAPEGLHLAELFYARYYLYRLQKKHEFESVLEKLSQANPEGPTAFLETIVKVRAQHYLKIKNDLFL